MTSNVFNELEKTATNQKADLKKKEDSQIQHVEWSIKVYLFFIYKKIVQTQKFQGGTEYNLKTKITL
jgi:hypothetical protein